MEYIYQSWITIHIFFIIVWTVQTQFKYSYLAFEHSVQVIPMNYSKFMEWQWASSSCCLILVGHMADTTFVLTLQINKHDWRIQVCVANIHIFTISVLAFLCTRKQDLLKWWKTRTARENCHKTKQEGRKKGRKKGCKHA